MKELLQQNETAFDLVRVYRFIYDIKSHTKQKTFENIYQVIGCGHMLEEMMNDAFQETNKASFRKRISDIISYINTLNKTDILKNNHGDMVYLHNKLHDLELTLITVQSQLESN